MIPFVQFAYRNRIHVDTTLDERPKRAVYRISNVSDLERFMQNHFYVMRGVIEQSINKKLNI